MPMTDEQLARFCGLDPRDPRARKFIATLSPDKRATFERMAAVETEWNLHIAGLGPRPAGVLIDTPRSTRRRRAWR